MSQVINFLNLEQLKNRLIGGKEAKGLSGGQQRLVTIATQMIYNPGMIRNLALELDAWMSFGLAQCGRSCFDATIHNI